MSISQSTLKSCLLYSPETGDFLWLTNGKMKGKKAGTAHGAASDSIPASSHAMKVI